MALRPGRCTNELFCSYASSGENVFVPGDGAFVCPQCGKPLAKAGPAKAGLSPAVLIGAGGLVVIAGGLVAAGVIIGGGSTNTVTAAAHPAAPAIAAPQPAPAPIQTAALAQPAPAPAQPVEASPQAASPAAQVTAPVQAPALAPATVASVAAAPVSVSQASQPAALAQVAPPAPPAATAQPAPQTVTVAAPAPQQYAQAPSKLRAPVVMQNPVSAPPVRYAMLEQKAAPDPRIAAETARRAAAEAKAHKLEQERQAQAERDRQRLEDAARARLAAREAPPPAPVAAVAPPAPAPAPAPVHVAAAAVPTGPSRGFSSAPVSGGMPAFPADDAYVGKSGAVTVSCHIQADGHPAGCSVLNTRGGPGFKSAVLRWLGSGRVKFSPILKNGQAVSENHTWTVNFQGN